MEREECARLGLREWLRRVEAWRIASVLREQRGNRSAAARALGIGRRTLYTRMEKLGLVPATPSRAGRGALAGGAHRGAAARSGAEALPARGAGGRSASGS